MGKLLNRGTKVNAYKLDNLSKETINATLFMLHPINNFFKIGGTLKTITVKDIMVSLSDYATVSEEATLFEAIIALDRIKDNSTPNTYPHRAILVFKESDPNKIIGKLSMLDVLKALEPKYDEMSMTGNSALIGFSKNFIRSLLKQYSLFNETIELACKRASNMPVKQFMYTPSEGEYVEETDFLDTAIHQLVMGHHQSLLVTEKGSEKIVGILRLTDVFHQVCEKIKEWHTPKE